MVSHTLSYLKKWSCQNRDLPPVSQIKALHVYDFDNTLFMSPLPNPKLWTGPSVGFLQTQDCFVNGGWWHDQHILEATGEGIEKEEPRAWEGWWNNYIVNLVELSMRQKDALTILLTGRGEHNFANLLQRIVASKKLDFNMICLKQQVGPGGQRFPTTMQYKQSLLEELIYTYKDAEEIKVYEDRPKHVRGFRDFFEKMNRSLLSYTSVTNRKPITAEVVQVAEITQTLNPVAETAEVQRMINDHNLSLRQNATNPNLPHTSSTRWQLKRTIFFTGYLIAPEDTSKLLTLITLPKSMPDSELKFLANNILITPRPAQQSILDKVGGLGAKQIWKITGIAVYENKIWAARVAPIPPSAAYYTENPSPIIVLACRKGAKPIDAARIQNWQPVPDDKQFVFETTVGEKVQLRIDKEVNGENEYENLFAGGRNQPFSQQKRKHVSDEFDDRGPPGQRSGNNDENRRNNYQNATGNHRGGNQNRGRGGGGNSSGGRNPPHAGRGGRGGNRGGGGAGGVNRGRGRGGYKSLDDVGTNSRYGQGSGYQNHQPNYDDGPGTDRYANTFPALGSGGGNGVNGGNGDGAWGADGGLTY